MLGAAGGRFIIDEYRRGSNGIMPSGHMLEAHRKLWDSLVISNKDEVNPDAIEIWNKMLEALNFEFMYSVSAYKYFFWKRGIIRTNISREPIRNLDKFDQIDQVIEPDLMIINNQNEILNKSQINSNVYCNVICIEHQSFTATFGDYFLAR